MKKKLLSLVAAAAVTTGLGVGVMASPASAQGDAVAGCQLTASGTTPASCDFIGVETIGTYQLSVELGSATLDIWCDGVHELHATASGAVTPGISWGNYQRRFLLNNCHATLVNTGSALTESVATFS